MATVYCGVDFHARKQTVSYLTTEDGEVQQIELPLASNGLFERP